MFMHRPDNITSDDADHLVLFDPGDKLTATRMSVVGNQPWSAPLDLIHRETNGLWIEFRVIQECQLTKPPELAGTAGELARKPIRHVDANEPLTAASVENNGME
jgi:hypothetical protein